MRQYLFALVILLMSAATNWHMAHADDEMLAVAFYSANNCPNCEGITGATGELSAQGYPIIAVDLDRPKDKVSLFGGSIETRLLQVSCNVSKVPCLVILSHTKVGQRKVVTVVTKTVKVAFTPVSKLKEYLDKQGVH